MMTADVGRLRVIKRLISPNECISRERLRDQVI